MLTQPVYWLLIFLNLDTFLVFFSCLIIFCWKLGILWMSPVVQWLRVCTSIVEGTGLIPGEGTKIPHAAGHCQKKKKKERKELCAVNSMLVYTAYYIGISEKAMAPHSSTLAWKIPWTQEPGRLQSMGSLRVRHDWATSLSLFTFLHWRRKWQPTPVFLPGESQGRGTLVGCRLWGRTALDTTEVT